MSDQNTPDYGTPPEPRYGRRTTPPPLGEWDHVPPSPEQIKRLREALRDTTTSSVPRRDPFGTVLAIILLIFAFAFGALAAQGGWWSLMWILFAPFAMFGGVGLIVSTRVVPRDENGTPIP